jgi:hypothetical protein
MGFWDSLVDLGVGAVKLTAKGDVPPTLSSTAVWGRPHWTNDRFGSEAGIDWPKSALWLGELSRLRVTARSRCQASSHGDTQNRGALADQTELSCRSSLSA